ncbi:ATP-grasp domain-containing protein [Streptomyces virginiae]|uniref:ATP-grasp domain-containing protein n=1 Tax=Streptomyces virginiae TaxID=1961 RepID=UPI00225012E9|nr:ATP-grasp domain-containing protein [Streptomyces virginiae]MCX4721150.1 ATP-grasp domain-containing protein [Streptomyces virginiae]MCX5275662.1 ATP-grasp domain-containing protein [Streptomyces virginiae]
MSSRHDRITLHSALPGRPTPYGDPMHKPGRTDTGTHPLLILISTGPHKYREYLLSAISTRYRVHLIDTVEPTWQSPYLVGNTVVSSTDLELVSAAAFEIASRETVQGVLSWDEARVHQAAAVAGRLGLPTTPAEAVWRCRDKHQSRSALALEGVPQPAFALVGNVEEALTAAAGIGYPVVVKPRAAAASFGVSLVRSPQEMTECFGFADQATVPHMPDYNQAVLVEEYLDGPEVSVDSVVVGGRVRPLFVGHKQIGYPPYFEETGHVVSHGDPLLADPLFLDLLQETHTALGFTEGWTHSELKLSSSGAPKVIEVNARLGGDLIPYLGMAASGINPGLIAAAVACGRDPEIDVERDLVAAVRFLYVDHDDTVIDSVEFDTAALPPEIDQAVVLAAPGDIVSPPPRGLLSGRVAFVTAIAAKVEECEAALDAAAAALRVVERDRTETR